MKLTIATLNVTKIGTLKCDNFAVLLMATYRYICA